MRREQAYKTVYYDGHEIPVGNHWVFNDEATGIPPEFSFMYEAIVGALKQLDKNKTNMNVLANPVHTIIIKLIGSRMSAKSQSVMSVINQIGYAFPDIKIVTPVIRYEPAGATETFNEIAMNATDLYNIQLGRHNYNISKRAMKIGSNNIRVLGLLSNRSGKKVKLGMARGVKKDLMIRVYEEATEIPQEMAGSNTISLVNQGTGGAKLIVNIFIANPWVASQHYVKDFVKENMFQADKLAKDGQVFKQRYDKQKKTLNIWHVSNHRINGYLTEAEHQELYDLWDTDPRLAMVADLGMPGISKGLIYAPLTHMIQPPKKLRPEQIERIGGGIDWGQASSANGSATTLIIGRIGTDYNSVHIDHEYYHSNSSGTHYKSPRDMIKDIITNIVSYTNANLELIKQLGGMTFYYDAAAYTLGTALEDELLRQAKGYIFLIDFKRSYKHKVPVRVDVVTHIMSTGRYHGSEKLTPHHFEELGNAMWDDTKLVNGMPTRLNENDHTLDAMEYFIGKNIMRFADQTWAKHNKPLQRHLGK